ncbi:hypothetical protein PENSPDRAFT_637414 [Peniophora sp. CONT]|nr:hypothetical protein PENSPDRAFT_637414 [Peniophora sp. CONT]
MPAHRWSLLCAILILYLHCATATSSSIRVTSECAGLPTPNDTTNFDSCLQTLQNYASGCNVTPRQLGLLDNKGIPVENPFNATALTLELCREVCGAAPVPFQWDVFSSGFGAWLLPWLALIPQLPFGSRDRRDNMMSMVLALGSPALAAYSLIFTVLNGHWIARRLTGIEYPNVQHAWRVLSSLQQSALRIDDERGLFSSLVVLPENDEWWKELARELDYKQTWSLAGVAQIAWVLIAYILTVIDSLTKTPSSFEANGQGVGSVFLWLLPIVIGYLQLAPKCDDEKVRGAVKHVNRTKAYQAGGEGTNSEAKHVTSGHYGVYIEDGDVGVVYRDEQACAPIYNYARFLSWTTCAEYVARAYKVAHKKAANNGSVGGTWEQHCPSCKAEEICCRNRVGGDEAVRSYVEQTEGLEGLAGTGVFGRFLVSTLIALALQWGTVGGGTLVVLFTPTRGLGCRSGAYILYAGLGTLVWLLMVLASFLSHYAGPPAVSSWRRAPRPNLAASVAIGCRRLGKVLAIANAVWILVVCIMQFSNIFNECWCNSSAIGLRDSAYIVITLLPDDIHAVRLNWGYALALSFGTAAAFVVFVALDVNPPAPGARDR